MTAHRTTTRTNTPRPKTNDQGVMNSWSTSQAMIHNAAKAIKTAMSMMSSRKKTDGDNHPRNLVVATALERVDQSRKTCRALTLTIVSDGLFVNATTKRWVMPLRAVGVMWGEIAMANW